MSPLQSWAHHYMRGGAVRFAKGEKIPVEGEGGAAFGMYPSPRASKKQGALSGFLEGLMGAQNPDSPSVLQPEYDQYAKGKKYGDLAGIAAMALPGMAAARGPLNAMHYQATRGMRAPVFATETAVTNPSFLRNVELGDQAGMAASRSHLAQEAMRADPKLASRPFGEAQGAWQGSQGFEANPLFTQEMPRHLGKVSEQDYMKYAAQLSKNLNQDANAVTRFTPQLIPQMSSANAAQLSGVTPAMIKAMGNAGLTNDMVIAARPGNKALVMGFGDEAGQMKDLLARVKEHAPKAKVKLGTSKQDADRVFMMKNDEGWAPTYESFGAR